ncbi:hypothetical protein AADZ90_005760 [Aestuariibius sp. 2305UL40-4]|uniref:hypothetical protein n=1 Tax=Aestuariibius violaceus TaxID=3234132 RepID=UPI00345E561D
MRHVGTILGSLISVFVGVLFGALSTTAMNGTETTAWVFGIVLGAVLVAGALWLWLLWYAANRQEDLELRARASSRLQTDKRSWFFLLLGFLLGLSLSLLGFIGSQVGTP